GQLLGHGRDLQLAHAGLVDLREHSAVAGDLGVLHQTVNSVHRTGRAAGVIEHLVDFVNGMVSGPTADDLPQLLVICDALLDACKLGGISQLGAAHHTAQDLPKLGVSGGDDHVAVTGREHIIGIGGLITVADPLGDTAGRLIDHGDILHSGGHRVHQCHVDLFTQTCPLLVHQGRQHADGQVQPSQHVAHGGAAAGGRAARPAGGAHQSAHGLTYNIITRT
ncbi:Mn-containing catalase (includes spore coat protein CotJC), partial [Dysosmobacter welbionis]